MSTIKEYLTLDHRKCDELFADMEYKASISLADAKEIVEKFVAQTERHFQLEERIVFEEFEQKTGMTQGPTQIMRHEHSQVRNLMKELLDAISQNNKDKFFGTSETLMILMQQHNMKEEQMLYPLAQQHLDDDSDRIIEIMKTLVVE